MSACSVCLKYFRQGVLFGAGSERLQHARAFDAWSTASELMCETMDENRRLKKEIEFLRSRPADKEKA